jgi:acyl-CoA reductase-like NAD-dependent aldehyde dehydrogenase
MGAEREDVDRHGRSPITENRTVTSETRVVASPWSGEEVGRVADAGPAELDAAAAAALRGFAAWRATPAWRRSEALAAIAAGLAADREGFARSIALEAAKPIRDARLEVDRAAGTFTLAAEEARRLAGEWLPLDLVPGAEGRSALVRRVPVGPVLGITPFNFPLNLVAHKVAPALAAGASIVIKPAPQTPLVAGRLAQVAAAAGVPGEVFQVVPAANRDAARLVEDPRFAVLSFTGSPQVGWALKGRAGRKRVLLELGGNAAVLVHRDADVEAAARRAVVGGFSFSGQVCISVQRAYVHRSRFDDFLERFVAGVRALAYGDPLDERTQVSALIRPAEVDRLAGWVAEARAAGARTIVGGEALGGGTPAGRGLAPTVLTGTGGRPDLRVVAEEAFGPLVVVEPYDDVDEAFAAVNAGRFGLQAGVWSNDLGLVQRAFERLDVGAVLVNEVPTWRSDAMPYGGMKDSGLGREGVRYAMEEMTERKTLVLPAPPG